jgi:hypothetical protein
MKKGTLLFAVLLLAIFSFTSCTDLSDEDELLQDTVQVDPSTVKPPTGG